jgi:hypothetical protein
MTGTIHLHPMLGVCRPWSVVIRSLSAATGSTQRADFHPNPLRPAGHLVGRARPVSPACYHHGPLGASQEATKPTVSFAFCFQAFPPPSPHRGSHHEQHVNTRAAPPLHGPGSRAGNPPSSHCSSITNSSIKVRSTSFQHGRGRCRVARRAAFRRASPGVPSARRGHGCERTAAGLRWSLRDARARGTPSASAAVTRLRGGWRWRRQGADAGGYLIHRPGWTVFHLPSTP